LSDPADNAFESKGFVYVLSTKAIPDLLKIGFSLKHPAIRAQELSGSGMPHPYRVEYCAFLNNPYETEQAIHRALAHKHEAKEFFRISAEEAILAITNAVRGTGHVILYEEGGLKARELEKKQAEDKALALAEERRKKWWLKCAPRKTLVIKGFEPVVEGIEDLASRIRFFDVENDQDLSFIFGILKNLRMPEDYVLDWAYYPDVFMWGARTFPHACFFSRRKQEEKPRTFDAFSKLPEKQRTFPFGLEVVAPPSDLEDQALPNATILGFVELATFKYLRYAFVERTVFVVCGKSTLQLAVSGDGAITKSEIDEAMRFDFDPMVTISSEENTPKIDVQLVVYGHGAGLTRGSSIFSLTVPVQTFKGGGEPLLRLQHQTRIGDVFVNPSFIVHN
jgi:hypothetical protein